VSALAGVIVLACPASVLAGGVTGSDVVSPANSTNAAGRAEAFSQTASASGTVDRLSAYLDGTSTAAQFVVRFYTDASSRPDRRLARCTVTSPRAGAWESCRVTAVSITGGRGYWAAILQPRCSTGTIKLRDCVERGGTDLARPLAVRTVCGSSPVSSLVLVSGIPLTKRSSIGFQMRISPRCMSVSGRGLGTR
jgi:hypothetical protein